jgi:Zn-dependent protease
MPDFNVQEFLIWYVCLLLSLSVHEAAHAFAADRCGDPTGRLLGRMTLNPIPHIDIVGTVVMPILMFVTSIPFLIGWAKPVPFNPRNLRNMRSGRVLIALAGPASNLLMALVATLLLRLFVLMEPTGPIADITFYFGIIFIVLNVALMLFNLIPIPPLDGHHVLHTFVPRHVEETLERIGPFMFIALILFGRRYLGAAIDFFMGLIYSFVLA